MGEVTISVSVQVDGVSQEFKSEVRRCANLNCERGPDGKRKRFQVEAESNRQYCSKPCRVYWNNKGRK